MICKYCGKELPEGSVLCCFCGEPVETPEEVTEEQTVLLTEEQTCEACSEDSCSQTEPEEELLEEAPQEKKAKLWVVILAAVAGLALLAVLAGAILFGLGINPFAENDILAKDNYTVDDDTARKNVDVVVATVGDETLTSGELQIYYWETVMSFVNSNYYYLSSYGLDINKPLDQQTCLMAEGQSWQQFFLEMALETWQRYTTLQLMAQENGYEMEEDMKTFLEGLPDSMQSNATSYGFDTVIAWLEDNCGPGVSEAGYMEYVTAYYEGTFYLTEQYDSLAPSAEEVETYFAENEHLFADSGITKEGGKYYDVRHILIEIEGGTADAEGNLVYSDEEWETCRKKAQDMLDEWKEKDGTEGGFGNYAMLYSADGGSSANGGLYTDLTAETNFVEGFKNWYLDESRKAGDTGLVQSNYGYHIMYFSGSSDIWFDAANEELLAERINAYIDAGMETHTMKVNYKKITLGDHSIV